MFTEKLGEGGDWDVEFILSVQGLEWVYLFRGEARRCEEVRKGGTTGAGIWETGEHDRR